MQFDSRRGRTAGGAEKQNISRMEKGIISPNLTTLSRYAAALGGTFVFQFNPNSSYATKE